MLGALVPIVPFLILLPIPQLWAYLAAVTAALILGLVKSRYTLKSAFRNGAELLLIVTAGTLAGVAIRVLLPRV